MRVVTISLSQLLQLRSARKSFIILVCGSWQTRHQNQWLKSLELKVGSNSYVLFRLIVSINSEAEEYCIDTLHVGSLPSLALFSEGQLYSVKDISGGSEQVDLSECRNADYLYEELIKFQPHNKSIVSLITDHASVGSTVSAGVGSLFLSGDRSSVGKSSMCLAILVSLLKKGVSASALAYIKPVTQCEAEQPVTMFCDRVGIANRAIGPVVFYKGFTRAYLAGETGPAESLLEEAKAAVEDISQGKLFTLVDGVGYPSVGSICNLSNADVAKKLNAPVLLVGKSGVGDAVDSYNLNSAYFELKGVRVLGGVFNKLPLEGYYSLENCKEAVTSYFEQYKAHEMPYGFVPTVDVMPEEKKCTAGATNAADSAHSADTSMDVISGTTDGTTGVEYTEFENALSEALMAHVDLDRLMHDIWMFEIFKRVEESPSNRSPAVLVRRAAQLEHQLASTAFLGEGMGNVLGTGGVSGSASVGSVASMGEVHGSGMLGNVYSSADNLHSHAYPLPLPRMQVQAHHVPAVPVPGQKRSREEVEQEARKQGALGG